MRNSNRNRFNSDVFAQRESQSVTKTRAGIQAMTTLTAATFNFAATNSAAGSGRTARNGGTERFVEAKSGLIKPLPIMNPSRIGIPKTQQSVTTVKCGSV